MGLDNVNVLSFEGAQRGPSDDILLWVCATPHHGIGPRTLYKMHISYYYSQRSAY